MASGAAEVKAVDRNRKVEEAFGPRAIWPNQIRVQQAMAEVAGRCREHRLHVVGRKRDVAYHNVFEVGGKSGDLVDNTLCHLIFESATLVAVDFDRERVCERACRVLTGRREAGIVDPEEQQL